MHQTYRRLALAALVIACSACVACKGDFTLENPQGTAPGQSPPINETTPEEPDPFPDIPCEGVACEDPVPSITPRVTRLTHGQWENSVRDLLKLDAIPESSSAFLGDTLSIGHFDRLAESLIVTEGLWEDYREAAEDLAAQIATDPDALNTLVPADAPTDLEGRSLALVEELGHRAHRRPLTDSEIAGYLDLMSKAPMVFEDGARFEKAAELFLRAVLQSPHFLYRLETHTDESQAYVALDPYEKASKLSYALWNTMPDEALFEAASRGDLDDRATLTAEVARMLDDPKATDAVADFHAQLLGFGHFDEMSKAPEVFPEYNDETPEKLERELEAYIEDVVVDSDGTYRTLMTATHTFADAEIAEIYGVAPPAEEFGRVELDPMRRKGLLTRAGFLALNATAYDPNPIHRGVFVDERILCINVPAPPDDFSIPEGVEGDTNRERIENATGPCGGACHTPLINPPGFAFENYDALGSWRDQDNGFDVDPSGELTFDGEKRSWNTASQLIEQIADSPQAHECYVRNWFEYLNGRLPESGDEPVIARLAQASHSGDITIKEMLNAMVTSNVFLMRDTRSKE